MTNGRGKSDSSAVPAKSPNKVEGPAAEATEGRGLAEGNLPECNALRTQGRESTPSALERVRQAASKDKKQRFTALLHHIYDVERLRTAYLAIKKDAAAGVDGETWEHYGENLEANLQDLSHRLKRGAYRARPVRRVYIPKVGKPGELRPLGVPALEDKIVQRATVEVLNAIYVAAKPAAVLADERSARETRPVVPVAIPGDGAGDQSVESPGVKVLVGKA
jgi:RNA-directed DNA polymerase